MLSFRVISGQYKGRRFQAPKNLPVRPTTDRAKEALFNILTHQLDWEQTHLLDLYAGTGSISYEFLSRGGAHSTAVDNNRNCIHYIRDISQQLELTLQVVQCDVISFLEKNKQPYDWVFMDPPFSLPLSHFSQAIALILKSDWFEKGLLVVEHPPGMAWEGEMFWVESRRYGGSHFSFFSKE